MLGQYFKTPAERVVLLLVFAGIGAAGLVPATAAFDLGKATLDTAGSIYLDAAVIILAAFVALKPETHGRLIFWGLTAASVLAAAAGFIGYFDLATGAVLFTKFGRASGTFNDPNVSGSFLVPAFLYAVHSAVGCPAIRVVLALVVAGFLALGVVISFSRGAWLNLAVALAIYAGLAVLAANSNALRRKISALAVTGALTGALTGAALVDGGAGGALHLETVAALAAGHARAVQSYDAATGRHSSGHAKTYGLILEHPAGLDAARLARGHHQEEPRTIDLSMPLSAGWIGAGLNVILVSATLGAGFLKCFERRPAQPVLIIAYAAFAAAAFEGVTTGTGQWLHFYPLMALVLGLAVAPGAAKAGAHLELRAPRLGMA